MNSSQHTRSPEMYGNALLFARTPTGKTIAVEVGRNTTVASIKNQIRSQEGRFYTVQGALWERENEYNQRLAAYHNLQRFAAASPTRRRCARSAIAASEDLLNRSRRCISSDRHRTCRSEPIGRVTRPRVGRCPGRVRRTPSLTSTVSDISDFSRRTSALPSCIGSLTALSSAERTQRSSGTRSQRRDTPRGPPSNAQSHPTRATISSHCPRSKNSVVVAFSDISFEDHIPRSTPRKPDNRREVTREASPSPHYPSTTVMAAAGLGVLAGVGFFAFLKRGN